LLRSAWKPVAFGLALLALLLMVRHADAALAAVALPVNPHRAANIRFVMKFLLAGGCLCVCLWAVHFLWKPFLDQPRLPRAAMLLGILAFCTTIILLLPPFQAPDEMMHWRKAMEYYRPEGVNDPACKLATHLGSYEIPFHGDHRQDVGRFHKEMPDDLESPNMAEFGYVSRCSYPLVLLVSLFYPRTATTAETLHFYYLCRVVPAVVLLLLLFWTNRRYRVPYTALVFFSLPIVLQQCCTVSADNFLNLGTFAAVLLFLHLRRSPSVRLTIVLWLLCLFLAYSKFVVAGVLVLPLLLVPFARIPRKKIVVPLCVLAFAGALAWFIPKAAASLRHTGGMYGLEQVDAQFAALQTWDGMRVFLGMYWNILRQLWGVNCWSINMGWLDVPLSPLHFALIHVALYLALLLDLCQFGPLVVRAARSRWREVALAAGVIATNLLANTCSVALAYFIVGVPPGGTAIAHWQMRHFFPGMIVLVLMPMLLWDNKNGDAAPGTPRPGFLAPALNGVALVFLPLLFFARNVELAIDLLARYWW